MCANTEIKCTIENLLKHHKLKAMKNEIIITNDIPDNIKIKMLQNLIKMIQDNKDDYSDIDFKTNLRIDYYRNRKTIKAKIIGNIK